MRDVKKVVFAVVLIIIFVLNTGQSGVFTASAFDPGIEEIYSEAVFMVNLDTDIAVFRKNEFERVVPASTVKIMTALLVLDHVENLNSFVTVTNAMNTGFVVNYSDNPNFHGAGVADFAVGQTNLTYKDCLLALMLHSACDAANILAHDVGGGSIENFITMMNQKAQELGCIGTNFTNPHGLYEAEQYTTAYDMFLITKYVIDKHGDVFMDIVGRQSHDFPANARYPDGITLRNTNRLLQSTSSHFYEHATGVKTGSLPYLYNLAIQDFEPGIFGLVSTATRDGLTYLLVTLDAPFHTDNTDRGYFAYTDHRALHRWAFNNLEYKLVLSEHDVVAQVPVINGTEDRVQLRPVRDFNYILPARLSQNAVLREITLHEQELNAAESPISRGQVLGYVELLLAGDVLTRIDLVAMSDVEATVQARIADRFYRFFFGTDKNAAEDAPRSFPFGLTFTLILIVLIFFGVILRILNNQREKHRRGIAARNRNKRRPPPR